MRLVVCLVLAAACGGGSANAIQGAGAFVPNAIFAERPVLADGGIREGFIAIGLSDTTPVYSCQIVDGGFPDGMPTVEGELEILIDSDSPLIPGSYNITTSDDFFGNEDSPPGSFAFIDLTNPTNPPSTFVAGDNASLSGTLNLTHVGDEWTGSFSATMVLFDGGTGQLSASFDTRTTCLVSGD